MKSKFLFVLLAALPISASIGPHPRLITSTMLSTLQSRMTGFSGCSPASGTDTCQLHSLIIQAEYVNANEAAYKLSSFSQGGITELLLGQILNGLTNATSQSCMTNVCSNLDSSIAHTGNQYMTSGVNILNADISVHVTSCSPNCATYPPPYEGNNLRNAGPWVTMAWDLACGLVGSGSTSCQSNATWGWTSANITAAVTAINQSSQFFLHGNPSHGHGAVDTTISHGTGPGGNQYAWWHTTAMIGYLTYGDNATDSSGSNDEINNLKTDFTNNQQPWWNNAPTVTLASGQGGHHFESPEYGFDSPQYAIWNYQWVSLFADPSNPWLSGVPNFAVEIANDILHDTSPTKSTRQQGGTAIVEQVIQNDTQTPANAYNTEINTLVAMSIAMYAVPTSMKPYVKYWLDNIGPTCLQVASDHTTQGMCYVFQALFYDPTVVAADYRSVLPPWYFSPGMGQWYDYGSETTPSAPWSDSNATWLSHLVQWPNNIHRSSGNVGSIELWRKGQWIVAPPPGYDSSAPTQPTASSWVHSVFEYYDTTNGGGIFKGAGASGQTVDGVPLIQYFEASPSYTYSEAIEDKAYITSAVCNSNNCQVTQPGGSDGVFSGSGLNDLVTGGKDTTTNANATFTLTIANNNGPDQFTWTCVGVGCTTASGGPTNWLYSAQTLTNSITVQGTPTTVNAATWASGSIGTITLAVNGATPVNGGTITLAGFTPSTWNGTYTITSTSAGTVVCTIASNPGTATKLGTATLSAGAVGHHIGDTFTFSAINFGDFKDPINVSREVIYLKPTSVTSSDYVVVLDRGKFNHSTQTRQSFILPTTGSAATLSGNTVTSTTTSNKGFVTFLSPASPTVTTDKLDAELFIYANAAHTVYFRGASCSGCFVNGWAASGGQNFYTARAATTSAANTQLMLSVVQAADSGSATAAESLSNGQAIAAHIKDSTDDKLAVFSANNPVSTITLPFTLTYTPAASTSTVLVTGLPLSTALCVAVTRSTTWSYTFQTCGSGTAAVSSANGTLFFKDNGSSLAFDVLGIQDNTPIEIPATSGSAYTHQLVATGGLPPYTWSVTNGATPSGISLSSSGALSGTTTSAGTTFTVQATDANSNTVTKVMTLNVIGGSGTQCLCNTTSLPAGTVGSAYSQTLSMSGCAGPTFTQSAGAWPPGSPSFAISSPGGVITGTPTTAGNYNFTISWTDTNGNGAATFGSPSLVINNAAGQPGGTGLSGTVTINGTATAH